MAMECPRCFYIDDQAVDDRRCAVCGRSYRPSVNVYLGLVALVYLVLLRYLNYVLTGAGFFDVWSRPRVPWAVFDWARQPVDILYRPQFIIVLGMMLGLLVLVPVVMSILYGKRGGGLLAAIALLLGPSWMLGAVLFVSSWLAGGWTLRMSHKTGSAIIGCLPVWAFLLVFSRPTVDVPLPGAYYVPALVAAVFDLAVILVAFVPLKRLNWNARVAGVILCGLCVVPMGLYMIIVGEDELHYELLSRSMGLESRLFEDIPGSELEGQILERIRLEDAKEKERQRWKQAADKARGDNPLPVEEADEKARLAARLAREKMAYEINLQKSLEAEKTRTVELCRKFLGRYPNSRHVPEVLFTMVRALDMGVDTSVLREPGTSNQPIHFDASHITGDESHKVCERLAATWFPDSCRAAVAMTKLADWDARHGAIDQALQRYARVLEAYRNEVDAPLPDLRKLSVFTNLLDVGQRLRARARADCIDEEFRAAQRQRAFLTENRDCPNCRNAVLADYLGINPFAAPETKRQSLTELLKRCPRCKLVDNIALELALLEPNVQGRMSALEDVITRYKGADGAAEAICRLAGIKTDLESNRLQNKKEAMRLYQDLLRDYPESYLVPEARRGIRFLEGELLNASKPAGAVGAKP